MTKLSFDKINTNDLAAYKKIQSKVMSEIMLLVTASNIDVTIECPLNKYTSKQRGSLHIWCEQCAAIMKDKGMNCEVLHPFTKETYELPWSMELFKENIYKYVLFAMTGKQSTEDQSTVEPSDVAQVISKRFAENGLICPPWPSALQQYKT